jgi:hypothetical protein
MIFIDGSDFASRNSKRDGVPYEPSFKPSSIPDDACADSNTSSEEESKEE